MELQGQVGWSRGIHVPRGLVPSNRDCKVESASLPLQALSPDAPPMRFNQVPRDREPQPGPTPGTRPVGLVEALEDARQVAQGDAHPGVLHPEPDRFTRPFRNEGYSPSWPRELD